MSYTLSTHHRANSQNARIRYLVLHYTAVDFNDALRLLTQGQVSAHYLIPEDHTHNTTVYQLVDEEARAWHAGASYWQGTHALNDASIGIELVNRGFTEENGETVWYPFNATQITTLIALIHDILKRHAIDPTCVVGHSDIAPARKQDPGPRFPWQMLYEQGIGAWPEAKGVAHLCRHFQQQPASAAWVQQHLHDYGYAITLSGTWDTQTRDVLSAFQMHFRPEDYRGNADAETCAILANLVDRYGRHSR